MPYNVSKSALQAHQSKMNHLSHNISNVDTIGFKKKEAHFSELLHNEVTEEDVRLAEDNPTISNGRGIKMTESKETFSQGALSQTGDPLHLAIGGSGFFGVRNAEGELLLTRDGAFHLSENGQIVNDRGDLLEMNQTIPANAWPNGDITIDQDGVVTIQGEGQAVVVGDIPLYLPSQSSDVAPAGSNMYRIVEPDNVLANQPGMGSIMSGYTESSTVDLAQSLVEMIATQRAYSLNAKVAQSTDENYSVINQMT